MSLETLLSAAAGSADWEQTVAHRCAWCKRVADADGVYRRVATISRARLATDGACPACGERVLAQISRRAEARRLNAAA